jgi:hypothetical protein
LIVIYDEAKTEGKSYQVGEYFSGIDRFISIVFHESKHVDQIARADALVPSAGNDTFAKGWSWGSNYHNHWSTGPDGKWGVAGVDDEGDGVFDNAKELPDFEPGNGDDINLTHATFSDWPNAWPLPNPMSVPDNPIESEAVNYADQQCNEHDHARDDWSDVGKNHKTIDKWND